MLPSNNHQRDNLIISQVIFISNSETNTGLTFSIPCRDQFVNLQLDLAVDDEGNVFASDGGWVDGGTIQRNSSIQKFSSNGTLITAFTMNDKKQDNVIFPTGIDIDKQGDVYVSSSSGDSHALKFSNNGTLIAEFGKRR